MKVEKIRFRNLASLEGEWEIDLTGPDFERSGIFAITGATGAGKTTIFDAIRLALFRRTDRLGGFSGTNEIMTRGAGECFAKLQFSHFGQRYIAFWSQRRARGRPDGNLQEENHTLALMQEDGKLRMISERLRQTEQKIFELLKMDYDHFSRAMLLPQGEFAKFLKSTESDRSEILEQITGSKIYKQISMEAHQKCQDFKHKFELETAGLKAIVLLTPDMISSLEQEQKDKSEEAAHCTSRATTLERRIDLEYRLDKIRAEHENLIREEAQAAPELEKSRRLCSESGARADAAKQAWEERIPVIKEARKLDETLRQLENEQNDIAKQIRDEENEASAATGELQKLKTALRAAKETEQAARTEQAAHPEDAALPENFVVWTEKLRNFKKIRQDTAKADSIVETHQEILKKRQQEAEKPKDELSQLKKQQDSLQEKEELLKRQYAEISGTFSGTQEQFQRDLLLQAERVRELAEAADKFASAKIDLANLKAEQKREEEEIARKTAELEQLEEELNELKPRFQNLDFATARARLTDGEPCPVCGALHHPYAGGETPEEIQQKHERYLLLFEKQVPALRIQLAADNSKFDHLAGQLTEETAALNQESARLNAKLPPEWNFTSDSDDLAGVLQKKQGEIQKKIEQNKQLEQDYRDLVSSKEAAETAIRKAKEREDKSVHDVELAALSLAGKQEIAAGLRAEMKELEEELVELLSPFHCPLTDAEEVLTGRLKQFQERSEKISEAVEARKFSLHEIKLRTDFLQTRQERIGALKAVQAEKTKNCAEKKIERARLLDGRSADEVEEALKKVYHSAGEQKEKSLEQLHKLEQDQAVRAEQTRNAGRRLTELQAELAKFDSEDQRSNEERAAEAKQLREKARSLYEEAGAIARQLEQDHLARGQRREAEEKLNQLRRELERWQKLNELIGKFDGSKFQQFAQSLIFEQLIAEANQALCRFTDRYELVSIENAPLDFNVIDHYQCDVVRSIRNLSGGESFLVSMALALALPRLSGEQLEIDTLFLDEGFGTLDEETLSHVLSQIQALQKEGKLVGIITHVPNIEQFVPLQIRLVAAERSGRSRIVGPGVSSQNDNAKLTQAPQ